MVFWGNSSDLSEINGPVSSTVYRMTYLNDSSTLAPSLNSVKYRRNNSYGPTFSSHYDYGSDYNM